MASNGQGSKVELNPEDLANNDEQAVVIDDNLKRVLDVIEQISTNNNEKAKKM